LSGQMAAVPTPSPSLSRKPSTASARRMVGASTTSFSGRRTRSTAWDDWKERMCGCWARYSALTRKTTFAPFAGADPNTTTSATARRLRASSAQGEEQSRRGGPVPWERRIAAEHPPLRGTVVEQKTNLLLSPPKRYGSRGHLAARSRSPQDGVHLLHIVPIGSELPGS
jgi:hypothetical protein